ncbi:MAG: DUF2442 domain-containing protein [Calditrichia bacterium]
MKVKPIEVKALDNYKIWIKYSDGKEGKVDLSGYAGKGIFKSWKDYQFFKTVYIGDHGEIAWGKDIDLCPDSLYLKLTQLTPEQLFPNLKEESVDA